MPFFISVIDVPSGHPWTALDASVALLGRHLVPVKVPVADLGTIWGPSGVLLAAAAGPYCEIFSICKEIHDFHVPMMWSQGGTRNTDRRFCLDMLKN